jgi:photosystem II stability/assembly factor-like uncharacterized protein
MKNILFIFSFVIFSSNAFAQWDTLTTGTATNFNGIGFLSEDSGIVVGKNATTGFGEMRMTRDGGATFTLPIYSITRPGFNAVVFTNEEIGWVAGDSGYVFRSTDFGSTWNTQTRFTLQNLYAISFLNDSVGYIGGAGGVLYRTMDRGTTWDTLNSGTLLPIRTILASPVHGIYIAGDGGYMANSQNLGNTWYNMPNPFFGFFNINDMAITPNTPFNYIMPVGNSGMMAYGNLFVNVPVLNWTTNGSGNDINGIASMNGSIIECGSQGMIAHSTDAVNWSFDYVPGVYDSVINVTRNLTDVCYAGDTTAYICGANGRVLKSQHDITSVISIPQTVLHASAFPNPFSDELNIEVNLENSSSVQIEITDVAGRVIINENKGENFSGNNLFHVNGISSLTTGIYFVRVITENGVSTMPVVRK